MGRDFRLKLLYGREATESMRRLYPQVSTRMLIRHGDKLLAHATIDYDRVIKPVTHTIHKLRQDFEEQHVKKYLREYPQIAQPEMILNFIKKEQESHQNRLLLYDYPTPEGCLVRALGMRPFVLRSFRTDIQIRQNLNCIITALPYKSFCRSYRQYLDRLMYMLKSILREENLDDLHNYQWYFETVVALIENALIYCPEVLKGEVKVAELACTAALYYVRAMHKYNNNAQICDRLFLASVHFCN